MISDIARKLLADPRGEMHTTPLRNDPKAPESVTVPEAPLECEERHIPDPVALSERIGIKFEAEIPIPEGTMEPGRPVFTYRGLDLAWESDPPHIKVYAWATVNLFPGRPLSIDIEPTARLLKLSPGEVREAISKLVTDCDLIRTQERGRDLFRLNVRYSNEEEKS